MRSLPSRSSLVVVYANCDEEAFQLLIEGHRDAVQSHCRRMLGTHHDAEDAVQETMLRAWRGRRRYEGRSSPRSWLHSIATNVCIDAIGRRRKCVDPINRDAQETAPDAHYERRETLELAFIAALHHLPARQRAVLILREVMGFSAKEVAVILDTTVPATNSALQRARATLAERLPEQSEQTTWRSLADGRLRDVVGRLVDALEEGDTGTILVLSAARND
jgi:RNA polymerase sigma-70 factor, ECF subfamily